MKLPNYKSFYIITAFKAQEDQFSNLKKHQELTRWLNLWSIPNEETIVQYNSKPILAIIVSEHDYKVALKFTEELTEAVN